MSLKFLSKKSWHTTNLDNVEKVWLAEQNAEKEKKKLLELQKQINEERQIQELRELQVASGQTVKTVDTTLDWMYEGPAAQSEQTTEEYLLGKIYKPKGGVADEVKEVAQKPGSLWMNKISSKNDTFTRLHEDPMLVIKKNEKEAREKVINNPVKMARIRHQLAADLEAKNEKKRLKKERKKEMKKDKKTQRDSRDRDNRRGGSRSRERRRSRSRDRRRHSPIRDRRSRSPIRERNGSPDRRDYRRRRRDVSSSRSRSSSEGRKRSRRDDHQDRRESGSGKREGYGLIRTGGNTETSSTTRERKDHLGPRLDLLAKKTQREAEEEEERRRRIEKAKGGVGQSRNMDAAEREKRLKEMMQDAAVNDDIRATRHRRPATTSKTEDEPKEGGSKGGFLQAMRTEVYNSESGGGTTMEERLSRNRHYHQKGSDLDSHGFMKR